MRTARNGEQCGRVRPVDTAGGDGSHTSNPQTPSKPPSQPKVTGAVSDAVYGFRVIGVTNVRHLYADTPDRGSTVGLLGLTMTLSPPGGV